MSGLVRNRVDIPSDQIMLLFEGERGFTVKQGVRQTVGALKLYVSKQAAEFS